MKTTLYSATSRGTAKHGWLTANHYFSFAGYFNPERINFGALRVLNDDVIVGGKGFGEHPHENMEIITIPLQGILKHKDSMSNQWIELGIGEVQVMSAGTGLYHSEINGSISQHLKLFQIWIFPNKQAVEPRYHQKYFLPQERENTLQTLVSSFDHPDENSLKIHQDAKISRILLSLDNKFDYQLMSKMHGVFVLVIDGTIEIDKHVLKTRDAIGIENVENFKIKALESSDILFIEVPMEQI